VNPILADHLQAIVILAVMAIVLLGSAQRELRQRRFLISGIFSVAFLISLGAIVGYLFYIVSIALK